MTIEKQIDSLEKLLKEEKVSGMGFLNILADLAYFKEIQKKGQSVVLTLDPKVDFSEHLLITGKPGRGRNFKYRLNEELQSN
ncbi:hypothetical protein [Priestia endophytica]|uniref:Uncharacterized protein n=1 Tax=Priestia endophytica DSM 13796 TaxID=1121089 RepID=A0A1I6C0M7_9BACI|nr:hypothetical protein [Priestia endophytica]KYG33416.1 hypothetical protein AZF06_21465 [Priestia endophytica]SFQ86738.1 hypothetical protein SAMN02745910_04711 [Priestia endophytica DSM 13796]